MESTTKPQSRTMGSWHAKERSRASKPNGAQLNGRDNTKRENTSRRTWPDDGDSLTSRQFDLTFFFVLLRPSSEAAT
jgi:hypothetical protein